MIRAHRTQDADVVHAFGRVRKEIAHLCSTPAVGAELPERTCQEHFVIPLPALELIYGNGLAGIFEEQRFWIP